MPADRVSLIQKNLSKYKCYTNTISNIGHSIACNTPPFSYLLQ
jgi:hypothetical protein